MAIVEAQVAEEAASGESTAPGPHGAEGVGHAYWLTPNLIDGAPYHEIDDEDLDDALEAIHSLMDELAAH